MKRGGRKGKTKRVGLMVQDGKSREVGNDNIPSI